MPASLKTLELYGDFKNFATIFNPSKVTTYANSPERCVDGTAPTLRVMIDAYGTEAAELWLELQLNELNEIIGTAVKMTTEQLDTLAKTILTHFGGLKATDIMLFISQFLAGKYGKLYGSISPMAITSALNDYCEWRAKLISKIRREEAKQRTRSLLDDPNCITYEEYLQIKKQQQNGTTPIPEATDGNREQPITE